MREIYLENDIDISQEKLDKLEDFAGFLQEYNEKVNLTAITGTKDIHIKHFVDSLKGERFFRPDAKVLEVGSGAGFPSLPLKIFRDDLSFTLLESVGKKCTFLNLVIERLGLSRVEVLNVRAEDAGRDKKYREKYDAVCARAVAKLNTLCEYCLPFVRVGGLFIAYKGDAEQEVEESKNAVSLLGARIKNREKYSLGGERRELIIIEKIRETPAAYPRGRGKERSKPL